MALHCQQEFTMKEHMLWKGILRARRNKHIWKLMFFLDANTTISKSTWKERRPTNQGSCREERKDQTCTYSKHLKIFDKHNNSFIEISELENNRMTFQMVRYIAKSNSNQPKPGQASAQWGIQRKSFYLICDVNWVSTQATASSKNKKQRKPVYNNGVEDRNAKDVNNRKITTTKIVINTPQG